MSCQIDSRHAVIHTNEVGGRARSRTDAIIVMQRRSPTSRFLAVRDCQIGRGSLPIVCWTRETSAKAPVTWRQSIEVGSDTRPPVK